MSNLLTEDQQVELLLVHGTSVNFLIPNSYSWNEVYNWIKQRWPYMLTCESYIYTAMNWNDLPNAKADMNVLQEIHRYHKKLAGYVEYSGVGP